MATVQSQVCVSLEAGQDLSTQQFRFVTLASDGQVDPTGDGLYATGVLQNAPAAAGHAASVAISGITKVVCGGNITRGNPVSSDSTGRAVAVGTGDVVLGQALETGSTGRIISILFAPR